jgi:hypothetical protein
MKNSTFFGKNFIFLFSVVAKSYFNQFFGKIRTFYRSKSIFYEKKSVGLPSNVHDSQKKITFFNMDAT